MNDSKIRTLLLVILSIFSFQIYAKDTNNFLVISNKKRLEHLEQGVAKLGAEREHERNIKRKHHNEIQTKRNMHYLKNEATRVHSNKERIKKLEEGVAKLGAERERARIVIQGTHDDIETRNNTISLDNRTIQSIAIKERIERLKHGTLKLEAKQKNREQIQQN